MGTRGAQHRLPVANFAVAEIVQNGASRSPTPLFVQFEPLYSTYSVAAARRSVRSDDDRQPTSFSSNAGCGNDARAGRRGGLRSHYS
jgi:hypothetical protein